MTSEIERRTRRIIDEMAQRDEAELEIRVDENRKREFYCAPVCLAIMKPGGAVWLTQKIGARRVRDSFVGRWSFADNVLELRIPADRRRKLPQTYRLPINTGYVARWLDDARARFQVFDVDRTEAFSGPVASNGEHTVYARFEDTYWQSRKQRAGHSTGNGLLHRIVKDIPNAVRARVTAESEAAKKAEAAAAAAARALAEEQRAAAAEQRRLHREAVVRALSGPLATPAEIRALQSALNDAGFEAGEPDGIWGKRSAVALRKWLLREPEMQTESAIAANLKRLTGRAPADEIHIVDANGDVVRRLECTPGEALFFGGQVVPCGSLVQR